MFISSTLASSVWVWMFRVKTFQFKFTLLQSGSIKDLAELWTIDCFSINNAFVSCERISFHLFPFSRYTCASLLQVIISASASACTSIVSTHLQVTFSPAPFVILSTDGCFVCHEKSLAHFHHLSKSRIHRCISLSLKLPHSLCNESIFFVKKANLHAHASILSRRRLFDHSFISATHFPPCLFSPAIHRAIIMSGNRLRLFSLSWETCKGQQEINEWKWLFFHRWKISRSWTDLSCL